MKMFEQFGVQQLVKAFTSSNELMQSLHTEAHQGPKLKDVYGVALKILILACL